jgi:hypothetical protein
MENDEIFDIGADLSRAAKEMPFQPRGLVEGLFPFIYEASRRMSTRAISRWLEAEHGIKLSAVTIAKALRNSERHWQDFGEDIQVAALVIEDASGVPMEDFLFDSNLLHNVISSDYVAKRAGSPDETADFVNDCYRAEQILVKRWVPLNSSTQGLAAPYVLANRAEELEHAETAAVKGQEGES